jgi:hypothetical protein
MDALLSNVEGTIREQGPSRGVMKAYGLLRSEIVNLEIQAPKDATEREFIQLLAAHSYFFDYRPNLTRIYGTYERARFGTKELTEDEAADFIQEVRRLVTHMSQLTGESG